MKSREILENYKYLPSLFGKYAVAGYIGSSGSIIVRYRSEEIVFHRLDGYSKAYTLVYGNGGV